MAKIEILNTSILTVFGSYNYEPVSLEDAQEMVSSNPEGFESAVGHQSTAEILTTLLEVEVPVNRVFFVQEVGQTALVFKLRGRAPEGIILSREEVEAIGYDFGRLTRLS